MNVFHQLPCRDWDLSRVRDSTDNAITMAPKKKIEEPKFEKRWVLLAGLVGALLLIVMTLRDARSLIRRNHGFENPDPQTAEPLLLPLPKTPRVKAHRVEP